MRDGMLRILGGLVLVGALIGFLPFNVYPARVFLGDAGALSRNFLGRCTDEVAHHLPADRRVGIEQPLDNVHGFKSSLRLLHWKSLREISPAA